MVDCLAQTLIDAGNRLIINAEIIGRTVGRPLLVEADDDADLAAPEVSVLSTYKGSTYATLSGTSMASPHVAGVAALLLSVPAKCDLDLNSSCSPAEVQQRLEGTAQDLGTAGKDTSYGSGLVNAFAAVVGP